MTAMKCERGFFGCGGRGKDHECDVPLAVSEEQYKQIEQNREPTVLAKERVRYLAENLNAHINERDAYYVAVEFDAVQRAAYAVGQDAMRGRCAQSLSMVDIKAAARMASSSDHVLRMAADHVRSQRVDTGCRSCGLPLDLESSMADGCPCNSPRGVNHGLVPTNVCTCVVCDPEETGSSRAVSRMK